MKILITGGTNGMGKGVAKALASIDNQSHEVIILCRSKELGDKVKADFKNTTLNEKVSLIICDLTKLRDVENAINEIQSKHTFLDGLFINAGLGYAAERIETEDGMDSHFQVNYLSHFMLTLNLLSLLEKSQSGGRVIFNVTEGGEIFWDDMQMINKWGYEDGIHQAMVAKRMFLVKLHDLYKNKHNSKIAFIGFQIPKTVWSNQINIIPAYMRMMATLMKLFGRFITIEECGEMMAPMFTENQEESLKKSGKFITLKDNEFVEIKEDMQILNKQSQEKLWGISLNLCADEKTSQISKSLFSLEQDDE
ncbi:SDR family NAD(P)-dependent oxidoreductase [Alkalibacterium sp. f15]|uniref:SDR family NAD(P)-dependent oxidoreductase n=1 Tax=Alkalibacterium sp. f15 TaxID=3414029 RepID=UPI003BF8B208